MDKQEKLISLLKDYRKLEDDTKSILLWSALSEDDKKHHDEYLKSNALMQKLFIRQLKQEYNYDI